MLPSGSCVEALLRLSEQSVDTLNNVPNQSHLGNRKKRKRAQAKTSDATLPQADLTTTIGCSRFSPDAIGQLSLRSSFKHVATLPVGAHTEQGHVIHAFAGKCQLIAGLTVQQRELIACQRHALRFLKEGRPLPAFVSHKLRSGVLGPGEVDFSMARSDAQKLDLAPSFRVGGRQLGVKVEAAPPNIKGFFPHGSSIIAVNGVLLGKLEHAHGVRLLNTRCDVLHLRVSSFPESRRNALVRSLHEKIDEQNVEETIRALDKIKHVLSHLKCPS